MYSWHFEDGHNLANSSSLIAITLGRLRMDIDQCIDAYVNMFDQVFKKKRLPVTIRGRIQDRFDTQALEKAIKKVVVNQCGPRHTGQRIKRKDSFDSQSLIRLRIKYNIPLTSLTSCS